jgi:hypothetical protein
VSHPLLLLPLAFTQGHLACGLRECVLATTEHSYKATFADFTGVRRR